jgi:hypothetical protein
MERELVRERRRYSLLAGQMELLRPIPEMPRPIPEMPARSGVGAAESLSA